MNNKLIVSSFANITMIMLEITQSGIQIDQIIIKSDHIYTSGFTMKNTYESIHKGE